MNALDKLILMVPSLTKAEKRAFTIANKEFDYYLLYQLILENQNEDSKAIDAKYKALRPTSNTNVTALYLFDKIIDTLCAIEEKKNISMQLIKKIQAARVLMRKSFYTGVMDILDEVKQVSKRNKQNEIFLLASQTELDLLLKLDFVGISEEELIQRHYEVEESIKAIWKSEGVASLYDLMKYRTYHYDIMRSEEQKNKLNDLLMSELSINSSQGEMNFEAMKFHQLFQATYLMGVHDYKAALRALKELINIFKENPHVWENNQYYYIEAVETALQSLRYSKQYESMQYFIDQLDEVWANNKTIKAYLNLIRLQYKIIPYIDRGDFKEAYSSLHEDIELAYKSIEHVNLDKQAELHLYAAIIHFGIENFVRVREVLTPIIFHTKVYAMLPIMRTIRLLHLMAIYELDTIEEFDFELKSFKRKLGGNKRNYKVESLVLRFIQRPKHYFKNRNDEWKKWEVEIKEIREDVFEKQLLNLFDFTMWIESKLSHRKLSELLAEKYNTPAT